MWMRLRSKNTNYTFTASHSWDFHVFGTLKSAFWSLQVVVVCWMMFLQVQRRKSVCRASLSYCSGQCKRLSSCNKHFGLREAATGLPSHHKQTFRDRQESNSQASSSGLVHPWLHATTDVKLHFGHLEKCYRRTDRSSCRLSIFWSKAPRNTVTQACSYLQLCYIIMTHTWSDIRLHEHNNDSLYSTLSKLLRM